jgi:hypothetical protein
LPDKVKIRDFSRRRHFPGTRGNPFDVFLHQFERVDTIPAPVFCLLLLGLAALAAWGNPLKSFSLFAFFIADWLFLLLLPKYQKSFGPAKPPALILALMRSLVVWTPLAVFFTLQGIGTLLMIYGFWIEPHQIRLTRQEINSPKIPPERTIRLLHIGDLHIERITAREHQLLEWIDRLQPDLILFSGDVLSLSCLEDPIALEQARQILSTWRAPYGVYAVAGSPAVDLPELLPEIYRGLPIRFLNNEQVEIPIGEKKIRLIGLDCTHKPFLDAQSLPNPGADPSDFTVLLYHSPDLAPQASLAGVDLQLSGHTHGGQVRLPLLGAVFTGSLLGRRYSAGRYLLGRMTLYITRGLGMEGASAPRVRFLCPPEIILWEISGIQHESNTRLIQYPQDLEHDSINLIT